MRMNLLVFEEESDTRNADSTISHLFFLVFLRENQIRFFLQCSKNAGLKDTHSALCPLANTAILIYGNGGSGCAGGGTGFTVWESSDNGRIPTLAPQQLLHTHKRGTTWEAPRWKLRSCSMTEIIPRRWFSHNKLANKCRNRKSVDTGYVSV